ncbi:uncharacterized protein M437DRAFT_70624 [Aureobasidium melanogenum CBS 110374]|uniref:Uncharacterized protein n=1 Tax=Aureobasidium melanogenum (strain CBS 110374) TaxID=1043003 RepID=A0A074VFB6_AURM1|nr:uncharacterized protein M437DRAFT_70624 [Aureobasidium melanogenum CBS 110374]KEQ57654.1 hypothetical protein M437DRAFT_70624 [Aureobasidium melanogenum CBS 110374]
MSNGLPPVLYRCWSTKSAGDLRSRKNCSRNSSSTEISMVAHPPRSCRRRPTSSELSMSPIKRFLTKKMHEMLRLHSSPETDPRTKIYHAKDFAMGSGSSEEEANMFKNEYIFLWEVPDDNVIHTVSMDLVIARGFTLPGLHVGRPLPSSSDLRRAIVDHGNQLSLFERGYLCGTAACMFGVRAPVYDIALGVSCWGRGRPYIIDRATEEAIQDRMITVAEDLEEEGELEFLVSELSCLEDTHDEAIMEIGWELQNGHDVEDLQALLANEESKITGHRQKIAGRVEAVYQRLGF